MKRRQFAALAAATFAVPAVLAQDRTLKILVGFPPGGSVDVIARLLADKLRVSLGQNVIVDNKPGAGGRVALNEIKKAAPDGQTVVLSPSGALVIQPWLFANLGYDPVKDFTPISRVTTFDFAVTAGPCPTQASAWWSSPTWSWAPPAAWCWPIWAAECHQGRAHWPRA
jgi:tripartite-type tricarboxylate transporter receptor subunit TctC